jgi:hypothetical protein
LGELPESDALIVAASRSDAAVMVIGTTRTV